MSSKRENEIDADDMARIDAHAEYAALESTFENEDAQEHEWEAWDAAGTKLVVIRVEDRSESDRLKSFIELRIFLDVHGKATLSVHRSIEEDRSENPCDPHIPSALDPELVAAGALTTRYKPHNYLCLCLGEPVLYLSLGGTAGLAEALAKASAIMGRYEAEWSRHRKALRVGDEP